MADSNKIKKYIQKIQPEIAYCTTCQAYDGGEIIWVLGQKTDLEDLFNEYEVPEALRDMVADGLCCNNCGVNLSREADVGLKTQEQREIDKKWEFWHKNYDPRIDEFQEFLSKYPYLGLSHKIGQEIQSKISGFSKTNIADKDWWRARKPKSSKKLTSNKMYPPDFPRSEGRFNHYGQRVFYLASTQEAALSETLEEGDCFAWVQKFHIKKADNLLDLAPFFQDEINIPIIMLGLNAKLFKSQVDKSCPWKPQYFITRFLSDCAKEQGYKGIVFNSPKHYDENLVLFDWEKDNIIHVDEPKIARFNRQEYLKNEEIEF